MIHHWCLGTCYGVDHIPPPGERSVAPLSWTTGTLCHYTCPASTTNTPPQSLGQERGEYSLSSSTKTAMTSGCSEGDTGGGHPRRLKFLTQLHFGETSTPSKGGISPESKVHFLGCFLFPSSCVVTQHNQQPGDSTEQSASSPY